MNASGKYSAHLLRRITPIFVLCFALSGCGEEGIGGDDPGELEIHPAAVTFSDVNVGSSAIDTITLTNTGESDITLSELSLGEDSSRPGTHEVFELLNPWDDRLSLDPDEFYTLEIEYAPVAAEEHDALLSFRTNISEMTEVDIEVSAPTPAPELLAEETVVFDRTPVGSQEWRLTEIQNIGYSDLEIEDIFLSGGDENHFDISFPADISEADASEVSDGSVVAPESYDTDTHQEVVAADESMWVRVHFEAPDDDFKWTELIIETNVPQHRVAVSANSDAACLEYVGDYIDFGRASINNTSQQTVTLQNCSGLSETVITDMAIGYLDEEGEFEEDEDVRFAINEDTLPPEFADGGVEPLEPDGNMSFLMTYTPLDAVDDEAVLSVSSTDDASPLLVDIVGNGVDLECPIAKAEARIAETGMWDEHSVFGVPLDEIEFDGRQSYDPDEPDVEVVYEWSLTDQPLNSTAQLQNPESAQPSLTADIAGRYVVELVVYDGAGLATCDPAQIIIEIEPQAAIHVELTWEVPAAQDGTGVDLDLHYLHPNGNWSEEPWGVYWANPNPTTEWNDGSEISLDIDDRTGQEPENINHDRPDANYDYSVGVYYFSDQPGYGATDARVRIFFHDALILEKQQRLHTAGGGAGPEATTGDFWYVADIGVSPPNTPDINELQIIDELLEDAGFPGN